MAITYVDPTEIQCREFTISSAAITATGAGNLGHAQGVTVVPAPGANKIIEFISGLLFYDRVTANYGAGGNITFNWAGGGAAITGVVSNANSLAAAADKLVHFVPLAAEANVPVANTAIALVAASAFTQPGTAAGTVKGKVYFRVHDTTL
jgi:hypothetical protein